MFFLVNISQRAWNLIYVRERELEYTSLHFTIHIKTVMMPWTCVGKRVAVAFYFSDFHT